MDFEEIKEYWNQRAGVDSSVQSTTNDFYLRIIESKQLIQAIEKLDTTKGKIIDIGCGDGHTTISIAKSFPQAKVVGFDYSDNMVKNAIENSKVVDLQNLDFLNLDISKNYFKPFSDLAFTCRCLINLPDWKLQKQALENIYKSIKPGGYYLMIENFLDGQENFNKVRKNFGLPEIPIRPHNCFFESTKLKRFLKDRFQVVDIRNISSTYYLVSRVIYSKICQKQNESPNYFDPHHEYGSQLPETGNFGPIKLWILRRK
jgi:ubiquinone/menaquinone biosynthesis C-methylase UbiE